MNDYLADGIKAYLKSQTDMNGIMMLNYSPTIADIRKDKDKAIGITVTDKDGTLNYGGSTGEYRQVITIVSVARTLEASIQMGSSITTALNGFGGTLATLNVVDKSGNFLGDDGRILDDHDPNRKQVDVKVLLITLADTNRTNLDDDIVLTTYTFNTIRG